MTENEEKRIKEALDYAAEKHKGQYRRGGEEYITHPIAVAETVRLKGGDADCVITALFHDLLEDTDAEESEIERIGGERVLKAVKLLTKKKGCVMAEYMAGIRSDSTALLVKGADRLHNLRSALCTDRKFREKYIKETREWFMDLLPEIPEAVEALESSLNDE